MTIREALKNAEMLYAAWCPATKHLYLTEEDGLLCAELFPDRDAHERYAVQKKDEGIRVDAQEVPLADRDLFLAELWRCGVERVKLTGAEPMLLSELFAPPQDAQIAAYVPDPALTGLVIRTMQEAAFEKADARLLRELLVKLRSGVLLGPVIRTEDDRETFPVVQKDGMRLALLFTDRRELGLVFRDEKIGSGRFAYEDMCWLLDSGFDAIAVNHGSGTPLLLNKKLLGAAEKV